MLSTANDIFLAFLDGVKMTKTTTILPEKFTRIWNEWALRDWMKSHGLYDERISMSPIVRDKFRNLIRRYYYGPDDGYPWRFSLPNGTLTGYGPETDPGSIPDPGVGIGHGDAGPPLVLPVAMEKYIRHLSAMFSLDYDTNTSQRCKLTGRSDWLAASMVFDDAKGILKNIYYLKPSDERLYYEIIDQKIYLDNGRFSEPKYIFLEYIRFPNHMTYDETEDEITYTIDLTQDQLEEVVDSAVRIHLEGVQSPRYQTFLNEEKIRHS